MAFCLTLALLHQLCQDADGSPAPPLQPDAQAADHDCDAWYENALCDDGCATAACYDDEDDTTDVELNEEVAHDVYVDEAMEQARKCFVLERGEGWRHTKH